MAIFCTQCGAANDDAAQFCHQCGAPMAGAGSDFATPASHAARGPAPQARLRAPALPGGLGKARLDPKRRR